MSRSADAPVIHAAARPWAVRTDTVHAGPAKCGAGSGYDRDGEPRTRYQTVINDPALATCKQCRRPWRMSRALATRAAREGWCISGGNDADHVERIDDPDDPNGPEVPLADDNAAIYLAILAGVPCDPTTGEILY